MAILDVKDLTKKYKDFLAVDNISFSLNEGEILGFLGPNGAGKTTTIQMLVGSLTPTAGHIDYFSKSLFKHREEILEKINYSTTYSNLPWILTVYENLNFISYLYSIKNRKERLNKIIEIFKLEPLLKQEMNNLSAGQRTRVNLAKAFINFPKVLLLDEPTASLDPDIAKYLREFIMEERKNFDVSVLFTSHNMREVEEICDRVIFINQGKIIANDTPQNLARKIDQTEVEILPEKPPKDFQEFSEKHNISLKKNGKYIVFSVKEKEVSSLLRKLSGEGLDFIEININKPTLEDYFLKVSMENKI